MQKILSLLLIMIMTILPMLSVSASVNMCQHSAPQSSDSAQLSGSMLVLEQVAEMSDTHDCCTSSDISCEHGGLCDCDNGQAAYSIVTSPLNTFVDYQKSSHKEVISDLFISNNSDSLYRPPITIL